MKNNKIAISVALSAALAGAAGIAWAGNPHFIQGPTAVLDLMTGDLTVSFKELGLGNTPGTYSLITAGGESTSISCGPSASAGQAKTASRPATTATTITPHNGQTTGSISLEPLASSGSCGAGSKCLSFAVAYFGVQFQDTTNNVPSPPAQLGDFSATLPACPPPT